MASEVITFFAVLAGIIFIGFFAEVIFKKTRIPDVLILIILGIIIGAVGFIGKSDFGFTASLFTTFTLIFLLFQGALNIEFKTLFQSLKGTLKLTVTSFIATTIVVTIISLLVLQFNLLTSLLIGVILSGTSSAVVIPIVSNLRANKKYASILTLESALSDVLAIVGAVTIIAIIVEGNVSSVGVIKDVLSSFVLAGFIGCAIGLAWILTLTKSKNLTDSYMVTIAVVMALYAFVESPFVQASGAIAVLAFGLMIGNSKTLLQQFKKVTKDYKENKILKRNVLSGSAKNFYSEISFFVKVFFFVYLGILFDFSNLMILILSLVVTVAIYAARVPVVKVAFKNERVDEKNTKLLRYLIPKGLAAAVLAQLALENNVPGADKIVNIVFSVIFISIIMTSVLVFLIGREPIISAPKEETKDTKKTAKKTKKETSTKKKQEKDDGSGFFGDFEKEKDHILPILETLNPFSDDKK